MRRRAVDRVARGVRGGAELGLYSQHRARVERERRAHALVGRDELGGVPLVAAARDGEREVGERRGPRAVVDGDAPLPRADARRRRPAAVARGA